MRLSGSTFLLLLALALCHGAGIAQPPDILWTREYWESFRGGAESVIATSDGGYVLCGSVIQQNHSVPEAYARKVDWLGNIEWTRFFGGGEGAAFSDALELPDGSLVFCGGISSIYSYPYLIRVDAQGSQLWQREVHYSEIWGASLIAPTADDGFAISGRHRNNQLASIDPYLIIMDSDGNVLSVNIYSSGSVTVGEMQDISLCEDGGWIMAGYRNDLQDTSGATSGGWLIRVDETGDTLWTRFAPRLQFSIVHCLPDGEIVVGGSEGHYETISLRLDSTGDEIWRRYYPGAADNLVVVGGKAFSDGRIVYSMRNTEGWPYRNVLFMTDSQGDSLWLLSLGNFPWWVVEGGDVAGTPQQGLIWLNYILGNTPAEDRQYLVKLQGEVPFVPPVPDAFGVPTCYPNPFNSSVTLEFDAYREASFRFEVFDILGRQCKDMDLGVLDLGQQRVRLVLPELSTGSYYGRLSSLGTSRVVKLDLIR